MPDLQALNHVLRKPRSTMNHTYNTIPLPRSGLLELGERADARRLAG